MEHESFFNTFYLAWCGASGTIPENRAYNWHEVLFFTQQQKVEPLVYAALRLNRSLCPDEVFSYVESAALGKMLRNEIKRNKVHSLLSQAYHAGLHVAVMKGICIAECYADPCTRTSSDVDLLVPKAERRRVFSMLAKDMQCVDRWKTNGHYAEFSDPRLRAVELHDLLASKRTGDLWFPGGELLYEHPVYLDRKDHYELECTQHFNFICFHLLNHFVRGGTGIQMCIDIDRFYTRHHDEIQTDRISRELQAMGVEHFWSVLKQVFVVADIDSGIPFGIARDEAAYAFAQDMIHGSGEKMVDDEALQVRYMTRLARIRQKHPWSYELRFKIYNTYRAVCCYLLPNPYRVRACYPDMPIVAAYRRFISEACKKRLHRQPGADHDNELERRFDLLKKTGILN